MFRIYEIRWWDGLRCHDIKPRFMKFVSGIQKWILAEPMSLWSILMLSTHLRFRLANGLFLPALLPISYRHSSSNRATCLANFILLDSLLIQRSVWHPIVVEVPNQTHRSLGLNLQITNNEYTPGPCEMSCCNRGQIYTGALQCFTADWSLHNLVHDICTCSKLGLLPHNMVHVHRYSRRVYRGWGRPHSMSCHVTKTTLVPGTTVLSPHNGTNAADSRTSNLPQTLSMLWTTYICCDAQAYQPVQLTISWIISSSGMWCHMALVRIDVSEDRISIIRATRIGEPGTALRVTWQLQPTLFLDR
jgi:hypothetical protein